MTETQIGLMRFENWQRWACGGEQSIIMAHYYPPRAAMAGQHVSSEVWDDDIDALMPIDECDAQIVEKMIVNLPCHLCHAVRFKYTGRPRHIGMPWHVINEWVNQAAREIMARKFHVIP
jgi:hypothetical protein